MRLTHTDRGGRTEVLESPLTHAQAAERFVQLYGDKESFVWYWMHKMVLDASNRDGESAIQFIADSFLVAIGTSAAVKRKGKAQQASPMIRLHYRDQRFKVYLSNRGTICLKTGRLALDAEGKPTHDPIGAEVFMGCLLRGKFLPARQGGFDARGPERPMTPTEREFLANLFKDPIPFMAQCSKDLGRCCYCNQPLSDPISKKVGYGAICAHRWGLPWGDDEYLEKAPSFAQLYRADCSAPQAFCNAIRQAPHDEAPWKMFSDWLKERGMDVEMAAPKAGVVVPRNDS